MNISRRIAFLLAPVLALAAYCGAATAAPILIAHPDVQVDELEADEVQAIFLGKTTRWNDRSRIKLCTFGSSGSKEFLAAYVHRTPKQFFTFWKRAVFSGVGEMPKRVKTDADMVAYVASTPNAVGFIDDSKPRPGVKVIRID